MGIWLQLQKQQTPYGAPAVARATRRKWHSAVAAHLTCFELHCAAAALAVGVTLSFTADVYFVLFCTGFVDCMAGNAPPVMMYVRFVLHLMTVMLCNMTCNSKMHIL